MLALPAPGCDADKESSVLCGICFRQCRIEPAGRGFHATHEKPSLEAKGRRGRGGAEKHNTREASDDEQDGHADASWRKKKKEGGTKSGTLKLGDLLTGVDLYALLEVSWSASMDQIKKSYRKLALVHHPDKAKGSDAAEVKTASGLSDKEQHFVKIQEAYEVLSDSSKRRQYDSSLDFDEDFPEEVDESLGFFGTFTPVFQRNSMWSDRLPVPELGDESTDIAKVHKFYDFWFNFETWRDFSMHDEYNLEEAEFREERRWMERQNQRGRKKYDQEERRRILRLAETAERLDPRIRAEREAKEAKKREEKEARARVKQEAEDAKRRAEEEKKQKAEQEKAAQEEKERLEREQNKQAKEIGKRLRQRAKKALQGKCSPSSEEMEELQDFFLSLENGPLEALCERFEALLGNKEKALAAVRTELASWKEAKTKDDQEEAKTRENARTCEEQRTNEEKQQTAASAVPWCAEEMGLLAKGLGKFPGGVGGRWALIAQFMTQNGYTRTEKEVIDQTKAMSDGKSLRSLGSQVAADLSSYRAPNASAKAVAPKAKVACASPAAIPAAGADAPADASSDWTAEQQKALEAALAKHPASLDKNDRWRLIAEDVLGKTKVQCVARFKYLREQIRNQNKG